jgi:hypothetical protein
MKITNKLDLPEPLVQAILNDPYDNLGTLSVSTLIRPPQAVSLSSANRDLIEEDASDRIWALIGQVGHTILERGAAGLDPSIWISERRFFDEVAGHELSGQVDLIHVPSATLYDFKFTSGWAAMDAMQSGKGDWRMQLSLLAMLARKDGVPIRRGKIIAIIRDWTKTNALKNKDWPQTNVVSIDMDIMSEAETRAWLATRLAEHDAAVAGNPRPCTDEERWHSPGKWAVYKRNRDGSRQQKAAKLEDSEEQLSAWIFANRAKLGDYEIEERPTEYRRCASYCSAAAFCSQYQQTLLPDHALAADDLPIVEDLHLPYKPQPNERY